VRARIEQIHRDLTNLAEYRYCADPVQIAIDATDLLTPPEDISTTECARRYRKIRTVEGSGHILWSLDLTPYLQGPQDALDDPNVQEVIIPKPGRTGGTVAFENHLFKRMRFGPMSDVGWYLGGPDEVKSYCDKQITPLLEDHPEISAKLGSGRSDNTITKKKLSGRFIEYLAASNKTITGRQFGYMVGDEIDTFPKRIRASFLQQARVRGRALGNKRKVGMTSHPDAGWTDGIGSAWIDSSRGIYVWPCPDCGGWSSPWPTKYWPDIPRSELWYVKMPEAGRDERIAKAMETAAMQCPHCGSLLTDEQRKAMSLIGQWIHRGQTLDIHAGPMGKPESNPSMGFWIHGLMSMMVTNAELARDLEVATIVFERTRKTEQMREVLAKIFGQIFEGAGASGMLDSSALIRRARCEDEAEPGDSAPEIFSVGKCPPEVRFITMAVDVGAAKFDVSYYGWDEEGRSWWLDRLTIRQRMWADRILRDIRTRERIEDWDALLPFIGRKFPIMGGGYLALPVAQVVIDVGDGNVTWLGREFAARCWKAGMRWGKSWPIVQLIQGSPTATAPELPPRPKLEDGKGIKFPEGVKEWSLGVHRLKELVLERLAVVDGGPGQCRFADGIASNYFEEFFGERLIEGTWVRNGPNESLDLAAYAEAARLMLKPDRKDINWSTGKRPPWATPVPVSVEGGDLSAEAERPQVKSAPLVTAPSKNIFDLHRQLDQGDV
jgi:phage terminase large subunit GpA-like protein